MPISPKYLAEFYENSFYHIYNRTNNKEPLFIHPKNYVFFFEKYHHYLSSYLDTYCWNLLPNHFHLMIRIKPEESIIANINLKDIKQRTITENLYLKKESSINNLVVKAFKRFFQSYAQSFNKTYSRNGNLFYKPFKRIEIIPVSQFTSTIIYIHANALKHGIVKDFREHKWSSWHSILSSKPTKLMRDELLDWFGGKEAFIKTHLDLSKFYYDNELSDFEDD